MVLNSGMVIGWIVVLYVGIGSWRIFEGGYLLVDWFYEDGCLFGNGISGGDMRFC